MTKNRRKLEPLLFKPDLEEAVKRLDAFYLGEIIDRPLVCVVAPRVGFKGAQSSNYYERVYGDMDDIIERAIISAEATFYGGEAMPVFYFSFAPDEIAVFTGAGLEWSKDSGNTNWAVPFVEDWEQALPLRIQDENTLWQRMLEFYRRATQRIAGKMLLRAPDLHTNMDLLSAIRGSQRLSMDLIDKPETIDRAMDDARAIFRKLWYVINNVTKMDEIGYYCEVTLQCDFSCMVSPEMFRRWVLPALEEEARIVGRAQYHWDGPGALIHTDDLLASRGLHTLAYVPSPGRGFIDHIDLFKRVQEGGKAVIVDGSPEEVKFMHRELKPEKVCYNITGVGSQAEAEQLLNWFVKNT